MATINDLNISITQMASSEAQALVRLHRESRRISKKITVGRKKSTPKNPEDAVALLTPEQKQQLLALLEGKTI